MCVAIVAAIFQVHLRQHRSQETVEDEADSEYEEQAEDEQQAEGEQQTEDEQQDSEHLRARMLRTILVRFAGERVRQDDQDDGSTDSLAISFRSRSSGWSFQSPVPPP